MKIAIDTSDLCAGHSDGITRYAYELASRLPDMARDDEWFFIAPCDVRSAAPAITKKHNTHIVSSHWPRWWTQTRFPIDLFRVKPDVLFMPIQQLPVIRPRAMKTVAIVHDLAIHTFPDHFTYKDWLLLHTFSAQVAHEADRIIAVSNATARDIERYYGRSDHVYVIHHGVDHTRFYLPTVNEVENSWNALKTAFPSITKPYILYIGQIQPRKNLIRLIEAFEMVHHDNPELHLVMAGGHGWLRQPIEERVRTSSESSHIHMMGRVEDSLLPTLYWNADVCALVSLQEGFGLPILEAMASGCPVVTSNCSSMPEVAGDAAVLIDPTSTESIAAGIRQAMIKKESLSHQGIERANEFTWEKTTKETLRILKIGN